MPIEGRYKGRVIKGKHRKEYIGSGEEAGTLTPYKPKRGGGEGVSYRKDTGKTYEHNPKASRNLKDYGPPGFLGYTGDHIGKIHIAALIPHFGRKKKRK